MSSMPLPPIGTTPLVSGATQAAKPDSATTEASFNELLSQFNEDQINADQAIQDLVTGKNDDVQQVVMQVVKSEMSFRLFMEVRNQLIDSYNEIMRMQF